MLRTIQDNHRLKKVLKIVGYFLLGIFTLFIILSISASIYFNKHKKEIVASINEKINENINGTVNIGDVNFSLLRGLPNFALTVAQLTAAFPL